MKSTLKLALAAISLLNPGFLHAQGYMVDAQITGQLTSPNNYTYLIQLNNESQSTQPIGVFWFAWLPYDYGYDLLTSYPNVTDLPDGWYPAISNVGYYPDGYSIEFYNYYGAALMPGESFTFAFTSADSPDTLAQYSPYYYYYAPTMTSFVYNDYSLSDPGAQVPVTLVSVPEPSPTGLLAICAFSLLFTLRRQSDQAEPCSFETCSIRTPN